MDKRTLKSIIVQMRNDEKTFEEISDILNKEYNIKMSRQAVNGMYKRATDIYNTANDTNILNSITDICKYYALGLSVQKIKDILSSNGINISTFKLNDILKNNTDYIQDINIDNIDTIIKCIKDKLSIEEIQSSLQFKGIKATDKQLNTLLELASIKIIDSEVYKLLGEIMQITNSKSLINSIVDNYSINIKSKEIANVKVV